MRHHLDRIAHAHGFTFYRAPAPVALPVRRVTSRRWMREAVAFALIAATWGVAVVLAVRGFVFA